MLIGPSLSDSLLISPSSAGATRSCRCDPTACAARGVLSTEQMSCRRPGTPPCGQAGCPGAPAPPLCTPGPLTAAPLLSQVQALEQRNQLLETRWRFLQGQDSGTFDLGHHYEEYQGRLQEELRKVSQERGQLEANLLQVLEKVEEFRIRYGASCRGPRAGTQGAQMPNLRPDARPRAPRNMS